MEAAAEGHIGCMTLLLDNGADPNIASEKNGGSWLCLSLVPAKKKKVPACLLLVEAFVLGMADLEVGSVCLLNLED